jgi:hypothetical protein
MLLRASVGSTDAPNRVLAASVCRTEARKTIKKVMVGDVLDLALRVMDPEIERNRGELQRDRHHRPVEGEAAAESLH